jgi:hypothetical protein
MQGRYQSDPFFRYQVAQTHIVCFYGFVQAKRDEKNSVSNRKLAELFIELNSLDIDAMELETSYYRFCKVFKLMIREVKKNK